MFRFRILEECRGDFDGRGIENATQIRWSLRANIRETVDPLEFSVQGGEAKGA